MGDRMHLCGIVVPEADLQGGGSQDGSERDSRAGGAAGTCLPPLAWLP